MRFDYSSLNGKIVEKFGSRYSFAHAMQLSERSISLKLLIIKLVGKTEKYLKL
ncbi:putative regulatory protein [Staphylococcus aureus]|nr:putative regulatory protein [Staphylococcus aureus]SBC48578.1 putative cro repressor [Staphylococcus aureus]